MEDRDRLAVALDYDDLVEAVRLAEKVRSSVGVAKVGLELFSAAGPEAIGAFRDMGFRVFLDLKLHDIPTTVHKAARVIGSLGVSFLTIHATAGTAMLRAGVDGLRIGAANAGLEAPTALAVTILTSDDGAPPHILPKRIAAALEAGCGGLVCAVGDAHRARLLGPRLTLVCPGIRPLGAAVHDQARAATPADALAQGADLLVVGRPITQADDPGAAAAAILADISAGIATCA